MNDNAAQQTPRLSQGSLMSKILKFGIPLAVSISLCVALFRDIDFTEMMRIIRQDCNFWLIGLNILLGMVPITVRAARWGIQLKAINVRPPFRILFYSIFGTYSFNVVFPRLGEVWRSGYIAYRQKATFSEVFGSMIADRLADTAVVALLTLLTLCFASGPFLNFLSSDLDAYSAITSLLTSPYLWGGLLLLAAGFWAMMKYGRGKLLDAARRFLRGIWEGFAAIARMDGKGKWLIYTALLWLFYFLQLYVAFYAFPLTRDMVTQHGIIVAFICYMLSTISMAIPSNGGIGPYQTAIIFGLQLFAPATVSAAVNPAAHKAFITAAAAFGNTVIAAQTLTFIIGGIIIFLLIAADKRRATPTTPSSTSLPTTPSKNNGQL
ncbi:MAG: flippase-like domain-containing protein [Muribaculaceae bacterium]|nr:flippase-like domain-containing protein [Muribaculaceae bacterium]